MVTTATSLRGREPAVDLDHLSPVPLGLVLQHLNKRTPSDITDGAGELSVLDHVFDSKVFDADRLVLADQACRELLQKSLLLSAIRAWTRATFSRAFAQFLEPFFFLAILF